MATALITEQWACGSCPSSNSACNGAPAATGRQRDQRFHQLRPLPRRQPRRWRQCGACRHQHPAQRCAHPLCPMPGLHAASRCSVPAGTPAEGHATSDLLSEGVYASLAYAHCPPETFIVHTLERLVSELHTYPEGIRQQARFTCKVPSGDFLKLDLPMTGFSASIQFSFGELVRGYGETFRDSASCAGVYINPEGVNIQPQGVLFDAAHPASRVCMRCLGPGSFTSAPARQK